MAGALTRCNALALVMLVCTLLAGRSNAQIDTGLSGQCSIQRTSSGAPSNLVTTSTCASSPNGATQNYTACCTPICATSELDPACFCVGYTDPSILSCKPGYTNASPIRTIPGCCSKAPGGFNGAQLVYNPVLALNGKADSRYCKNTFAGTGIYGFNGLPYAACCSADCTKQDSNRCFCVGYGTGAVDSTYDCTVSALPVAGCCDYPSGGTAGKPASTASSPPTGGPNPPSSILPATAPPPGGPYPPSSILPATGTPAGGPTPPPSNLPAPANGVGAFNTTGTFPEVQATNLGLFGTLRAPTSSFNDSLKFISSNAQFFVANLTGPLRLPDNATLIAQVLAVVSDPKANVTFSERIFHVVNNYTAVFSDVFNTGSPGQNMHYTAAWQKETDSKWYLHFASLAPANATVNVTTRTLPFIYATPANATSNSSQPFLNATVPVITTQPVVGGTAGRLFADLGNATIPATNISKTYFSPWLQAVLPGVDGPIPPTDPTFSLFLGALRVRNASAPAPVGVSYLQLSPEAALLTVLVRNVPPFGNVYAIQLWEFLYDVSWRLSLVALNIAPPL